MVKFIKTFFEMISIIVIGLGIVLGGTLIRFKLLRYQKKEIKKEMITAVIVAVLVVIFLLITGKLNYLFMDVFLPGLFDRG